MPRKPTSSGSNAMSVKLSVYQGDDKRWVFRLKQSDGTPFLLNGHTASAQFRLDSADETAVVAAAPLVEITDPDSGEITMTLPSEQSRNLIYSLYRWDLEITEVTTSWTTTVLGGNVEVTPEITRPAPINPDDLPHPDQTLPGDLGP